ncbi:Transposable element Tcb1 transposase [Araneus ventricosus]|uniref:Transposable element Tcb1 transposase n=1 Tax=Araneus ventricosus TaxID=182803 RepID=A0A4Y2IJY0_ARAVE|nr:Transposable element Tcb1 transposase [Araneus ventricosus]
MISTKNRKARVEWAKAHTDWTKKEWEDVLWSDESKYMFFGTDGIQWIRCSQGIPFDPKYQIPTMKHGGGNVMVWGCVSRLDMGPLRWIQGIMDKFQYEDSLENTMHPYARNSLGRGFIFQQDNDPKHRSKHIQNWLSRRHVTLLDWPSQYPDLNIIEGVWAELERRLVGRNARNADEKFSQLEEEWKKIPFPFIQTLLDSIPRRCQAVIDAKVFATKY